jgi:hypothetical protein
VLFAHGKKCTLLRAFFCRAQAELAAGDTCSGFATPNTPLYKAENRFA